MTTSSAALNPGIPGCKVGIGYIFAKLQKRTTKVQWTLSAQFYIIK